MSLARIEPRIEGRPAVGQIVRYRSGWQDSARKNRRGRPEPRPSVSPVPAKVLAGEPDPRIRLRTQPIVRTLLPARPVVRATAPRKAMNKPWLTTMSPSGIVSMSGGVTAKSGGTRRNHDGTAPNPLQCASKGPSCTSARSPSPLIRAHAATANPSVLSTRIVDTRLMTWRSRPARHWTARTSPACGETCRRPSITSASQARGAG